VKEQHAWMEESVHKERDNWRKKNMRMGGIPNVKRVRVLVIFYKWMKTLKCINIDTKVSYRRLLGVFRFFKK
jgi:hypothetical protein